MVIWASDERPCGAEGIAVAWRVFVSVSRTTTCVRACARVCVSFHMRFSSRSFFGDILSTFATARPLIQESLSCDVLVHVIDISNPNMEAQRQSVLSTLEELQVPADILDSRVEVRIRVRAMYTR